MSLRIGVSQRVTVVSEYSERRDALDQRWSSFMAECGLLPILIPNHPATARSLLDALPMDGFLLTGGNSLVALGGDAPERDATEQLVLEHAIAQDKPLLGVCRGMQFIQHYFGVDLVPVAGHVTPEHAILGETGTRRVNSFHQFAAYESTGDLVVVARADDGVVESIRHRHLPLVGIMWHPERCSPLQQEDTAFIADFFHSQQSIPCGSTIQ